MRSAGYLILAILVACLMSVVVRSPVLLVPVVLVGGPLLALFAAGGFGVGLWRLVWYGGRRQREQSRRERERLP